MRILITGITGTVGAFLARELLTHDPATEIHGTYRWRSRMEMVEPLKHEVRLLECDVRDGSSVRRLISEVRPDHVYHLAAQSNVMTSRHAPADTLATNVNGLVNVLEAVRELCPGAHILVPGSSEEYGLQSPGEQPIREENDLRPLSPYAVSKVTQDMIGLQYAASYKLHIVRTRAFNHTGPGREDVFVESNFARQIAEIEAGLREPVIRVGNLDVVRDYSDARDIVRAYRLALEMGRPGEVYNICSGTGLLIGEILRMLVSLSGVQATVVSDPERIRRREPPAIVGDCTRFRTLTGWEPRIPFRQTLQDILTFWRTHLPKSGRAPRESQGASATA